MKKLIVICSLLSLMTSCKTEELWFKGDYFFLRHKGSDMPIWVRGNLASKIFILHLHGGPGGSSIDEGVEKVYLPIENDYAMVYWDQRASGGSQGNTKAETLTMEQFVGDVELVIDLLNSRYNNPTIFLHGHSWGGALGAAFLGKGENQNKVKGWIELNGAHNWKLGMELSVQWVKDYADAAISESRDVSFWTNALSWYDKNPVIDNLELMDKHAEHVSRAKGYIYDINNPNLQRFSGWQLWSPSGDLNKDTFTKEHLIDELQKSYSDGLNQVTIPALILWGRHDGILPVELAQEAYDALGTDSLNKQMVIFENSAHSPNREEPDLFIQKMKQFIYQYK